MFHFLRHLTVTAVLDFTRLTLAPYVAEPKGDRLSVDFFKNDIRAKLRSVVRRLITRVNTYGVNGETRERQRLIFVALTFSSSSCRRRVLDLDVSKIIVVVDF